MKPTLPASSFFLLSGTVLQAPHILSLLARNACDRTHLVPGTSVPGRTFSHGFVFTALERHSRGASPPICRVGLKRTGCGRRFWFWPRRCYGTRLASNTGTLTCIEDLDLKDFIDLSGGRKTCLKKVEKAGDPLQGNPSRGSKISVHYSMRVLGGGYISSSRDNGTKPFQFNLGRWPSEAMHGWDKAVSSMHKGEVATLICGPQYAFGEKGAPPKIPPNATIETEIELVDWVDFVAKYNAKPGVRETDSERLARYRQEIAEGSSPLVEEAGLDKSVRDEVKRRNEKIGDDDTRDANDRKIYDVKSEEARKILSKQRIQGYTGNIGYIESSKNFEIYIPVPRGTRAKDVTFDIHPDRMRFSVAGVGVVTEGVLEGRVAVDGCYWLLSDMSLDPPPSDLDDPQAQDVRQGPVYRGETCVQLFLEKRRPYDTHWDSLFVADDNRNGTIADTDVQAQGG